MYDTVAYICLQQIIMRYVPEALELEENETTMQ